MEFDTETKWKGLVNAEALRNSRIWPRLMQGPLKEMPELEFTNKRGLALEWFSPEKVGVITR